MKALSVMLVSIRRLVRDRTYLFFVLVLPALVILLVGITVSGQSKIRIGVIAEGDGPLARSLVRDLGQSDAVEIHTYRDLESARTSLRRSELGAVVLIPANFDARLREGKSASIKVYGQIASTDQQAARTAIEGIVAAHGGRVQAAQFASDQVGGTVEENLVRASAAEKAVTPLRVETTVVNSKSNFLPFGFSYSAPTMLVLFVFINSTAGGAVMIQTRQLGVYDRMSAAPISPAMIIAGETLTYLALALIQSLIIIVIGAAFFGVHWGPVLPAMALVLVWALVGCGVGMLCGTLFRTPEQASAIGPILGIALGMLGGCMWPLEIVPPAMRTIGHLTPHAWAVDGWIVLLSQGGGLLDIGPKLLVLLGFAAVFLGLATFRMRRRLSL
jgi:ABC-2 type transport system permease protein